MEYRPKEYIADEQNNNKGGKGKSQMQTGNEVNKSVTNMGKNTSWNVGKSMVEELKKSAASY